MIIINAFDYFSDIKCTLCTSIIKNKTKYSYYNNAIITSFCLCLGLRKKTHNGSLYQAH